MEFKLNTKHFENIENNKIKIALKELYNSCLDES